MLSGMEVRLQFRKIKKAGVRLKGGNEPEVGGSSTLEESVAESDAAHLERSVQPSDEASDRSVDEEPTCSDSVPSPGAEDVLWVAESRGVRGRAGDVVGSVEGDGDRKSVV